MGRGTRANRYRPKSVPKKQKFHGNQFSDEQNTDYASKSAEKLKKSNDRSFDIREYPSSEYSILNFVLVFSTLSLFVKCKVCNGNISFSKYGQRGLGFKVCLSCECGDKYIDSSPMIGTGYEINRRLVFVMRLLGIGMTGIKKFCGLMELG